MEGYYQETGRAGRDGGEGVCVAFYSQKDIDKLQKFMKDKPVSEREIGTQILKEVIDYAESSVCRRKQLLHYFGENFDEANCGCMCDNCSAPKIYFDGEAQLHRSLSLIKQIGEKFDDHHIISILMGEDNPQIHNYEHHLIPAFGAGKEDGANLWNSLLRQALLNNFLSKDIDQYGLLRLTEKGEAFIDNPYSIRFTLNSPIEAADDDESEDGPKQGGGALDAELLQMLKDLRKKLAKQKGLPPFVIFQDPSLEEMCTHYPINTEELKQISGVGAGKALKFGGPFVELIKKYVEDNDIDRPIDMVIKSAANKSALKVYIIQNIDRHLDLTDIAASKGITYEEILKEVETIVNSGTKLNLNYYIDEVIDEDKQEEVFGYFRSAEVDSIDDALVELGSDDYTYEEVQLMRIKFISELGN
jgi:ATP-dependent DNA helicase RecQ